MPPIKLISSCGHTLSSSRSLRLVLVELSVEAVQWHTGKKPTTTASKSGAKPAARTITLSETLPLGV